jgi:hypothetical protein
MNEVFADGIINVLEANDGVILSTLYKGIRFGNRTIGVSRFFEAQIAGSKVERLISVPFNDLINRNDLIELKDFRTGKVNLFKITFYQPKFDTAPPCIYLTLERTDILYNDNRSDGSDFE